MAQRISDNFLRMRCADKEALTSKKSYFFESNFRPVFQQNAKTVSSKQLKILALSRLKWPNNDATCQKPRRETSIPGEKSISIGKSPKQTRPKRKHKILASCASEDGSQALDKIRIHRESSAGTKRSCIKSKSTPSALLRVKSLTQLPQPNTDFADKKPLANAFTKITGNMTCDRSLKKINRQPIIHFRQFTLKDAAASIFKSQPVKEKLITQKESLSKNKFVPDLHFHFRPTGIGSTDFVRQKKKPSLSIAQILTDHAASASGLIAKGHHHNLSIPSTASFLKAGQGSPAPNKLASAKRKAAEVVVKTDAAAIGQLAAKTEGRLKTAKKPSAKKKALSTLGGLSSAKAGELDSYLSACKSQRRDNAEESSDNLWSKLSLKSAAWNPEFSRSKSKSQLVKKLSFQGEIEVTQMASSDNREKTELAKKDRGVNIEIDDLLENLIMVKRQPSPSSPKVRPSQQQLAKSSYKKLVASMIVMENKRRETARPNPSDEYLSVRASLLKLLSILSENFKSTDWVFFNAVNILDSAASTLTQYLRVAQCALMISLKMQHMASPITDTQVLKLENKVIQVRFDH